MQRLITSHVEVSKIGRQIAEEVLDLQRRNEDSSYSDSPNSDSDQIAPNEISVILHFQRNVYYLNFINFI